jgi:hypothetical protein
MISGCCIAFGSKMTPRAALVIFSTPLPFLGRKLLLTKLVHKETRQNCFLALISSLLILIIAKFLSLGGYGFYFLPHLDSRGLSGSFRVTNGASSESLLNAAELTTLCSISLFVIKLVQV